VSHGRNHKKATGEINRLVGDKIGNDGLKGSLGRTLGDRKSEGTADENQREGNKRVVTNVLGGLLEKKVGKKPADDKSEPEEQDKQKEADIDRLKGLFGK